MPRQTDAAGYHDKKKALRTPQRKKLAQWLIDDYMISIQRACIIVMLSWSTWYYRPHRKDDTAIRKRILEISQVRIRYGIERVYILSRSERWRDNRKRVYRV
jgi:putative transposase